VSSISVPVAGQVVSVSSFGAPVVNALNAITDGSNISTAGNATIGGNLTVTGIGQTQVVRKTANETVNNTSVLQNDDDLVLTLVANAVYEFTLRLHYNSGLTPDFKFGWVFPLSTTMIYAGVAADTAGGVVIPGGQIQTTVPAICGAAADFTAFYTGFIYTSSTAGTIRLTWAQNTANLSNTTLNTGTYLKAVRVA
jgi:hypothetical protein